MTKKQTAITMLQRVNGATCTELEKRLGWQPHSIRGFLSSTVRKLPGFQLTVKQTKAGQRRYRLIQEGR